MDTCHNPNKHDREPRNDIDRSEVLATHYEELLIRAEAMLKKRGLLDRLEPVSVVNNIYADGRHHAPAHVADEGKLLNYLTVCMLGSIKDWIEKSNRLVFLGSHAGDRLGAHHDPGVATQAGDQELAEADPELARQVLERLAEGLSPRDEELVRRSVFEHVGWAEIAAQLSMSVDAAKKRLSYLRGDLRARLLEPLRASVHDAEDWQLIDLLFIQRLNPRDTEKLLERSEAEMLESYIRVYLDVIEPRLGAVGTEALRRLLGKARS